MKIFIITLFPEMIKGFFEESILKKAQDKKLIDFEIINLREFATDSHKTVDDRPYGGGAGMVIRADVVISCLKAIKSSYSSTKDSKIIVTSAKGPNFTQKKAQDFSRLKNLVIICGHYEGFDERIMPHIDEEISIGDFVLTGGEIPACAIADAVTRLIPGVLKKIDATQYESFFSVSVDELIEVCGEDEVLGLLKKNSIKEVSLLEYPHYTRPEKIDNVGIPEVLKSGNHHDIHCYRIRQAYKITRLKRPDLFKVFQVSK